MKEIELRIHDMSSTIHPADAYALVLVEVDGTRKLPVIIGHLEAQAIKSEMLKYKPPRPMTHDLFVQLGKHCDLSLHKVVIYQVKDGVYYSHMYFDANGEPFVLDARTSDAVALALRFRAPIYTTETILSKECLHDMGGGSFSVPVNMITLPMLKEALQKAVNEENYEQASRLRDEIQRREQEENNP